MVAPFLWNQMSPSEPESKSTLIFLVNNSLFVFRLFLECSIPFFGSSVDVSMAATTAVTFWSLTEAVSSISQSDSGSLPELDESSEIGLVTLRCDSSLKRVDDIECRLVE